jgi:hypothetical protein
MSDPRNSWRVPRGTARTFRIYVKYADGTETIKWVIGKVRGEVGALVLTATWSSALGAFVASMTAAQSAARDLGTYHAVAWRTDSTYEDVPVADGKIEFYDVPEAA